MRGYIDSTAGEIVAGDSLLDPMTGVLCRVTSVEPVSEAGLVAIHMTGSVSGSYMGLTVKPDRPIRRAPRPGDTTIVHGVGEVMGVPVPSPRDIRNCPCGLKSRAGCSESCLKG